VSDSDERLFLRVVEAGSLKAAAEQVGMDPSTLSRRLAQLEARLQVKLLHRSTRKSVPTDAGAKYYEGLRRLTEQQLALEAEIAGSFEQPRGRLRVTAPVEFGATFVVPVLEQLQEKFPDLEVDLLLGSSFMDLAERGIDVAIRIGNLSDSPWKARKLGAVPRVLVASKDYLKKRGVPTCPNDLANHDFIFYVPSNRQTPMEIVSKEGEVFRIPVNGRFVVNSVRGIRQMVERGRGIHLGPLWAYHRLLQTRKLKQLLSNWHLPAYPLHALYAPSPYVPAKTRIFIDNMAAYVRQQPTLESPVIHQKKAIE
jgi:DNA-binding transcriptional LysR family regulator